MNKTSFFPTLSLSVLILGATACTPSKDDAPPKPKVTATAPQANAASANPSNAIPAMAGAAKMGDAATGATVRRVSLPKIGPAPTWTLMNVAGEPVSSESLKGKVVVVDFWATWCPPCRAEIPGYIELQKKYEKDGLVIVGVSIDEGGPGVVKAFAEKFGINYPLVMADDAIARAFGGVEVVPTTFLIDRSGQIRDRKEGMEETAVYEQKIVAALGEKA